MPHSYLTIEPIFSEGMFYDSRVVHAIQLLQTRPTITAGEIAGIVRLSATQIRYLFKKQVGITISTYAAEVRLDRARELLETTPLSIKEIRSHAGIPDGSNFVRLFRRYFGMPPSVYRRQHRRFD